MKEWLQMQKKDYRNKKEGVSWTFDTLSLSKR